MTRRLPLSEVRVPWPPPSVYGGSIALQLALDAPEMVQSLAPLEPALLVGENAPSYRDAMAETERAFAEGDASAVVEDFLASRFGSGYAAAIERAVPGAVARAVAHARTTFEVEMPALWEWPFSEGDARRIAQPALVSRPAPPVDAPAGLLWVTRLLASV